MLVPEKVFLPTMHTPGGVRKSKDLTSQKCEKLPEIHTGPTDRSDEELMPILCKGGAAGDLLRKDVHDQWLDGACKVLRSLHERV